LLFMSFNIAGVEACTHQWAKLLILLLLSLSRCYSLHVHPRHMASLHPPFIIFHSCVSFLHPFLRRHGTGQLSFWFWFSLFFSFSVTILGLLFWWYPHYYFTLWLCLQSLYLQFRHFLFSFFFFLASSSLSNWYSILLYESF
jgi:hypothetical protein